LQLSVYAYGCWSKLYLDPVDGGYWELTYPQSEMHGGGPPQLVHISADAAKIKYGVD
jgi:immunity protein 27 of polymorphic toxin system